MGRNTYEKVVTLKEWFYPIPAFVLHHSNPEIPEALKDKVTIIKGEPKKVVEELNSRGYTNLYIDGGKLIQSFLREDLIDELIITTVPILLGDGIPLFGKLPQNSNLNWSNQSLIHPPWSSVITQVSGDALKKCPAYSQKMTKNIPVSIAIPEGDV